MEQPIIGTECRKDENGRFEFRTRLFPLERMLPDGAMVERQGIFNTPIGEAVATQLRTFDNGKVSYEVVVHGIRREFAGNDNDLGETIPQYWVTPIGNNGDATEVEGFLRDKFDLKGQFNLNKYVSAN